MREYRSSETWYRRLPIRDKIALRQSQRRTAHRWRLWATRAGLRAAAGVGSLAAAGAANFFIKVPNMSYFRDGRHGKRTRRDFGLPSSTPVGPTTMNDGGFNTYVRSRKRTGRAVSRAKKVRRITAAELETAVLRYNAVTSYSGIKGYHTLTNFRNTVTGDVTLPVHLYDLTAAINNQAGTVGAARVGMGVRLLNAGAVVNNYSMRGSAPDGSDFANDVYYLERDPWTGTALSNTGQYFGAKAYHCWTDIRLVLYSMLSTPTRFTLELVQFKDESYIPQDRADTVYPPTYPIANQNTNLLGQNDIFNFWADMMKPYVYNPIMTVVSNWQSKVRVLKRKDFLVQPRSTVNSDSTTPNTVELRWFHQHNTVRRYDWLKSTAPATNVELVGDDDMAQWTVTNHQRNVDYTKRVFLMIKAQALPLTGTTNPLDNDASAFSNGVCPSYDIIIRNKYMNMR